MNPTATHERMKVISLVRVSTAKQGKSGLGLEAQRDTIAEFIKIKNAIHVREYLEIDSSKYDDIDDRPILKSALSHCIRSRSRLVVAKLDRLTRAMPMYTDVKRRGVSIIGLDLGPDADEFLTDVMMSFNARERRMISVRTKAALAAYKDHKHTSKSLKMMYPDGVPPEVIAARAGKLGSHLPECGTLTPSARADGVKRSAKVRRRNAIAAYTGLDEHMRELRDSGLSFAKIAAKLTEEKQATRNQKPFSAMQVKRVLDRMAKRD